MTAAGGRFSAAVGSWELNPNWVESLTHSLTLGPTAQNRHAAQREGRILYEESKEYVRSALWCRTQYITLQYNALHYATL